MKGIEWEFLDWSSEKLPDENVAAFIKDIPNLERRFQTNINSKLSLMKNEFEEIREKVQKRGPNLTLPQYIKHQFDGFAEINLDRVRGLFPVDFEIQKHFFLGIASILVPLGLDSMSERRFVEAKYKVKTVFELKTGFSLSGPTIEAMRTHKDLLQRDPSGFKSVDLELKTLKGMMTELFHLSDEPRTRLMLEGGEFGSKMYKFVYNSLAK